MLGREQLQQPDTTRQRRTPQKADPVPVRAGQRLFGLITCAFSHDEFDAVVEAQFDCRELAPEVCLGFECAGGGWVVARVFVSYASEDIVVAEAVRRWLDDDHHEVFLAGHVDVGIAAGEAWRSRLYERLRWADALVCVVTSASVASMWCTAEVSSALLWGIRLIPIVAERGVMHPLLSDTQHIELTDNQVDVPVVLARALRRIDTAGGWGWPDGRSPFPGLRPLDVEDHRVFFGRTHEVEQLAGLLRSSVEHAEGAVLLVVGPSGCGKSSLVRAGLVHVMAEESDWWTLSPMLPGADPVAGLVHELAATAKELGLDWTLDEANHRVQNGGLRGVAGELLLAAGARRLLVVIDQFEEVLTQAPAAARAQLARLLRPALGGPVQVVATLRPEFLDQLLSDTALEAIPTHLYPLCPLSRDALRTVIEGPCRLAGIKVDEELVARMVADTDSGDALPLLAFTLAQLSDGVGRGGQLSAQRYDQIGGVRGALTSQAQAALAEAGQATGRDRKQVIAGLLRLATVDEQGRPTQWRVPRDELPAPVVRELDAFVRRRLLTTNTDQGRVVVGVAHEAFLSAWAPLAHAIQDNAVALRAGRAVEQAAIEWDQGHRPPARLWERGQLAAARADIGAYLHGRDLVTNRVDLSPTARDFLHVSIRRDRLRRGRAITVLSVLLILAVVAAGIAVVAQRATARERNAAVSQRVATQALELRATNPALAAQLALAAYRATPTAEARGSLLSTGATPDVTRLTGHTNAVKGVAISPDGHTLATGSDDKIVRLWDISVSLHPRLLSTLTGHTSYVPRVAFSPDGHILASASDDTTARLWDVRDPRRPSLLSRITGHTGIVYGVAFSPDGNTVATASKDATARLWDVRDPHHPHPLGTLTSNGGFSSVAFSPNGHALATSSYDDKNPRLWDVRDLNHPLALGTLIGHTSGVSTVAFSPDGHTLATASYDDGTARLWGVSDPNHPTVLGILSGHIGGVSSAAFSPDGHTLATSSQDTTARLWDISNPSQPRLLDILTGHVDMVYSVAFSPDGHMLATGSYDDTARLWNLSGPVIKGHTNTVAAAAFSPDGRTLATASYDWTARLWDVHDARQPSPLATFTDHTGSVSSVAFSSDGRIMATGARDGKTAQLWDIHDFHNPVPLATATGNQQGVFWVALSPDGHTLASAGQDTTVRLWDISDPHQPRPLATLTDHRDIVYAVAFSPDGRTLASASGDRTARLWNVRDPAHPSPLATLTNHSDIVYSIAFSPDGHTLATASADNTARLWDLHDLHHPSPLGALTGHTSSVRSVAFSPDGHTLTTASADSTAHLWETNIDSVTTRICQTTPTITQSEWNQYLPDLPYQPPCPPAT